MFLAYKFENNFSLSECRPGRENSRPEVVLVGIDFLIYIIYR